MSWHFHVTEVSGIHNNVKQHTKVISEIFQNNFSTHVTTSETAIKLFQPLKEFKDNFNIISATVNTLENIVSCNKPVK